MVFHPFSKEELTDLIRVTIFDCLNPAQAKELEKNNDLLKIEEVCKILQVSEVTVHKWKKMGKIPFHRISNRIFFKRSEIHQALKKVDTPKILTK